MKLKEQQAAFALDVSKLIKYIFDSSHSVTFADAYRSPEMAEIYAKDGRWTKDSQHCKRLAIDLNLFDFEGNCLTDKKSHEEFGIYWEGLNPMNRWGRRWIKADCVHFERKEQ